MYIHACVYTQTHIYVLTGICDGRTLCDVMHSPSPGRHNCVCLCREIAMGDARAMRKAGKALSPASRTAQGLDLTPEHQVLLARCVSVVYVYIYTHM